MTARDNEFIIIGRLDKIQKHLESINFKKIGCYFTSAAQGRVKIDLNNFSYTEWVISNYNMNVIPFYEFRKICNSLSDNPENYDA